LDASSSTSVALLTVREITAICYRPGRGFGVGVLGRGCGFGLGLGIRHYTG
jgi:hypothetical protein